MSFLNHENDAVAIAPDLHRVIFENDKIRVLDVKVKPGQKAAMHWHPTNMNYLLNGGKMVFTKPNGEQVNIELTAAQVTFSTEANHAVENIGDTEVHTIQIEFKD